MLPPARFATCRCQFLVQIVDIRRGSSPMTGPLHYSKTKARGHSTRDLVSSRDSGDRTWQDSSRFMSIFAGGLSSGRGRKSFKPQQRGPYEGSTQPGRHRPKVARPFRTARDCRFHRARSPVSAPSTCRSPLPSACSLRKSENRTAGKGKRSEEHTSELQSLMRISYAVFCLKNKKI